jgi:hypothetical protein
MITTLKTTSSIIICFLILSLFNSVNAIEPSIQTNPFAILKGYKCVRSLKGKAGEMLGYIYVKENGKYKSGILTTLLVVKQNGNKLDTLYRIDYKGFFNSRGKIELKNRTKDYYGFKLSKELKNHKDLFSTGNTDQNGSVYADDNDFLINWDYKKKAFEYYPMP